MLTSYLRLTTLAVPHQPPYPAWAWSFSGQSAYADNLLSVYLYQIPSFSTSLSHLCFFTSLFSPTYVFSDEDIDVGALVKSWLRGQPEECRSNLENWLGDYFQRALDWVFKQVTFALSYFYTQKQSSCFIVLTFKGFGLEVETVLTWFCMPWATMFSVYVWPKYRTFWIND